MQTQVTVLAIVLTALFVYAEAGCSYHARMKRNAKHPVPHIREKRAITCSSTYPYRSLDGTCNNLANPEWGSSGTKFVRKLDPVYDDDMGTPRAEATDGSDLPNPRAISEAVHFELSFTSNKHTEMLMQWGQFIDHDITLTPKVEVGTYTGETHRLSSSGRFGKIVLSRISNWKFWKERPFQTFPKLVRRCVSAGQCIFLPTDNGNSIDCCSRSDSVTSDSTSPCHRINVPNNDSYYADGKCINFVRSEAVSGTGTNSSNPRQQYNSISAFIDGSMIYGTTSAEATALRALSDGLLETENDKFLPNATNTDCILDSSDPDNYCFTAGDPRVNAFFGLGAMQTLFLREHNRVAKALKLENSTWDDEKLYQEARRIVVAELQYITYNHFLPEILSDDGIANYSLGEGQYSYNSSLNPSFSNVFSAAAFRYGHSQVLNNHTIGSSVIDTSLLFKRTSHVLNNFEDVLTGLYTDQTQRADAWYVDAMRNKMFETSSSAKDGEDIVSLNIQRGRDHGLPSYNEWRDYCGIGKITDFLSDSDFGIIQGRDLRDTYNSVDDIDLYSGAISEQPFGPAAIGRTYICLVGETFRDLRDGDRFWYETTDSTVGFTSDQRTQIERVTLAKVICDNTDNIVNIPRNVFKKVASKNPLRACSGLNSINFTPW